AARPGRRAGEERAMKIVGGDDPELDAAGPGRATGRGTGIHQRAGLRRQLRRNNAPVRLRVIRRIDTAPRAYRLHQEVPDVLAPVVHYWRAAELGVAAAALLSVVVD